MTEQKHWTLLVLTGVLCAAIGGVTTHMQLKRKWAIDRMIGNYFACRGTMQTLDYLTKGETQEVQGRLETALAQNFLMAEAASSKPGKIGEVARRTMSQIEPHRSNTMYVQKESELRRLFEQANGKKP